MSVRLDREIEREILRRYNSGEKSTDIAEKFGIHRITVPRVVKRLGGTVRVLRRPVIASDYKVCGKCKSTKIKKEFYKDKHSPDGYKNTCVSCVMDYNSRYIDSKHYKETILPRKASKERERRRKNPIGTLLALARQRAKNKDLEFNLSYDDIDLPEFCPVLNIPIVLGERKLKDNSPTIDRVNPGLGYIKSNVRVISWRANRLKSDASVREVEAILKYMRENCKQ
jgi:hypothetical protein